MCWYVVVCWCVVVFADICGDCVNGLGDTAANGRGKEWKLRDRNTYGTW